MIPRYALYGLSLATDLPLKAPAVQSSTPSDLTILRGADLPAEHPAPAGEVWAAADFGNGVAVRLTQTAAGWSLLYPNTAEVCFSTDLSQASIHAASGKAGLLPLLLASSVPTWWLNLRGESVLHASAVARDGRALAFIGASGMGKSTLATLLCADGAALITDDALRLEPAPEGYRCHFGPGELRLRPGAASLAGHFASDCATVSADGRTTLRPATREKELPRLAALVVPQPSREATALRCERQSLVQAGFLLNSYTRAIGWRVEGPLRRQFAFLSELARRVPVVKLTVPWGPPFAPELPSQIWQQLATQGI
ncbi:MAG: hypothetical protein ACKODH_04475 [Limisphaerales bacterium]